MSKVLHNWSGYQHSRGDRRLNGKDGGRHFTAVSQRGKLFLSLLQMESGSHFDAASEGVTEMHGFIHELHVQRSFRKRL